MTKKQQAKILTLLMQDEHIFRPFHPDLFVFVPKPVKNFGVMRRLLYQLNIPYEVELRDVNLRAERQEPGPQWWVKEKLGAWLRVDHAERYLRELPGYLQAHPAKPKQLTFVSETVNKKGT